MHQSGKGRNKLAQKYLLKNVPLIGLSDLNDREFTKFLNRKTNDLSKKLLKPDGTEPNWGAARKVLNIYLRLCAMNKDISTFHNLKNIESYLEVPLDNHIVKEIDNHAKTKFSSQFTIINLSQKVSNDIQSEAKNIATNKGIHRYELDVLFWNSKKIEELL